MPTDEQLIKLLGKIKGYCKNHPLHCENCIFYNEEADHENIYDCIISSLARQLTDEAPEDWNMEEIERIIKL